MEWYRVLFQFKGKPLHGWTVSEKLPFALAKIYAEQIKQSGYEPEIVKILDDMI